MKKKKKLIFNLSLPLSYILYNSNFNLIKGIQGTYEPIERLKERKGAGFAEGGALETPSKRTKKTDKAKLVRQVTYENI